MAEVFFVDTNLFLRYLTNDVPIQADRVFESLLETVEILSDREFMEQLREGIKQAERGETKSLEEFKAELGL